jgi:hypothetical protein
VTVVSFVISGLLLGAMIGLSWYGERTLPPDARIPLHFGIGAYNNFAAKTTGLIVWPAAGVAIFALLAAVSAGAIKANHGGSPRVVLIILPIVLAVTAVAQWGAISLARRNVTSGPGQ